MKIGVIGSSGGSVFQDFFRILRSVGVAREEFVVIVDRDCGLERFSREQSIETHRIGWQTNADFSARAAERLAASGAEFAVLYFARLVTKELFSIVPTINIHPALLPAFPGFQAVRQAFNHKARFLGATLHGVDASIDGGPVIAQICTPIQPGTPLAKMENYSFLQKLYLSLLLYDSLRAGRLAVAATPEGCVPELKSSRATASCNPCIEDDELLERFLEIQEREQSRVLA